LDESIALVEFSKHNRRDCVKIVAYAHLEVGLKIWNPHRFLDRDDYRVVRDPRFNVAYWNLRAAGARAFGAAGGGRAATKRRHSTGPELAWDRGSLTVRGEPVVFVHFSGVSNFEHYDPSRISRHQTRYRVDDFPALGPLLAAYTRRLLDRNASRSGQQKRAKFPTSGPTPTTRRSSSTPTPRTTRRRRRRPRTPSSSSSPRRRRSGSNEPWEERARGGTS